MATNERAIKQTGGESVSDKTFELSLIALSLFALLWIVLGGIFGLLGITWVIITGLVAWIIGGGTLLYFWGKNYMSRV
jgi:5-bromo-4-chloroindolyl phosphate hydrolysis protein